MAEQPPYLFDPGDGAITVASDVDAAIIDVTVHGTWRDALAARVEATLRQTLAACPAGIILDLTGLDDPEADSAAVWPLRARAVNRASPATRVAICCKNGSALDEELRTTGGMSTYASAAHARTALAGGGKLTDVIRLRLPPTLTSPSLARNLVGGACQEWQLPDLLHPGRAVLSELVTNVVEHARTDMDISISRRGAGLHLAVRDNDPTLPRVREFAPIRAGKPLDDRGRGLRVVHADSIAWGAIATTGGKMVWATVKDRGGRARTW